MNQSINPTCIMHQSNRIFSLKKKKKKQNTLHPSVIVLPLWFEHTPPRHHFGIFSLYCNKGSDKNYFVQCWPLTSNTDPELTTRN